MKTAMFTRSADSIMYVLKIANESRNHASPLLMSTGVRPAPIFVVSISTTVIPSPSQNPP